MKRKTIALALVLWRGSICRPVKSARLNCLVDSSCAKQTTLITRLTPNSNTNRFADLLTNNYELQTELASRVIEFRRPYYRPTRLHCGMFCDLVDRIEDLAAPLDKKSRDSFESLLFESRRSSR